MGHTLANERKIKQWRGQPDRKCDQQSETLINERMQSFENQNQTGKQKSDRSHSGSKVIRGRITVHRNGVAQALIKKCQQMPDDKKRQKQKCLSHLPVVENIAGWHEFLGMGITKFVKKIQVAIKKYGAEEGVIAGIIPPVNGCYGVVSFMDIRGNPVIESSQRCEQEKGKKQSPAQNEVVTLGH